MIAHVLMSAYNIAHELHACAIRTTASNVYWSCDYYLIYWLYICKHDCKIVNSISGKSSHSELTDKFINHNLIPLCLQLKALAPV